MLDTDGHDVIDDHCHRVVDDDRSDVEDHHGHDHDDCSDVDEHHSDNHDHCLRAGQECSPEQTLDGLLLLQGLLLLFSIDLLWLNINICRIKHLKIPKGFL